MFDRSVTREVFEGLETAGEVVFYLLTLLVTVIFFVGLGLKVRKYLRGRAEDRFRPPADFVRNAIRGLVSAATGVTVAKRDRYTGVFHLAVMWGFVVLFIGTAILTIETDIVGIFAPQYRFFHGTFYIVYSVILDVLGLVMIVGLVALAFPWFEVWSPVGWVLAGLFSTLGLGAEVAGSLHLVFWWGHALMALAFVAYIPFAKAIHMLTAGANLALRSPLAGRRLPVLPATSVAAIAGLAAPVVADGHVGLRDLAIGD